MPAEKVLASLVSFQITVSDLDTTEAFYAGVLDLPVRRAPTPPGALEHLVLEVDGLQVVFVPEDAVAGEHPFLGERLSNYPKGIGVSLHFRVIAIEAIFDAVMEEDLEIIYPLRIHPYGLKDIWLLDPDGYLVVLEEKTR